MIDAIDLALLENLVHQPVKRLRRSDIMPKGLLDYDFTRPLGPLGQQGGAKIANRRFEVSESASRHSIGGARSKVA